MQSQRARFYDPAVGRWISDDPIGFAAGDTNLVRYVANEVTTSKDPTGLIDYAAEQRTTTTDEYVGIASAIVSTLEDGLSYPAMNATGAMVGGFGPTELYVPDSASLREIGRRGVSAYREVFGRLPRSPIAYRTDLRGMLDSGPFLISPADPIPFHVLPEDSRVLVIQSSNTPSTSDTVWDNSAALARTYRVTVEVSPVRVATQDELAAELGRYRGHGYAMIIVYSHAGYQFGLTLSPGNIIRMDGFSERVQVAIDQALGNRGIFFPMSCGCNYHDIYNPESQRRSHGVPVDYITTAERNRILIELARSISTPVRRRFVLMSPDQLDPHVLQPHHTRDRDGVHGSLSPWFLFRAPITVWE